MVVADLAARFDPVQRPLDRCNRLDLRPERAKESGTCTLTGRDGASALVDVVTQRFAG